MAIKINLAKKRERKLMKELKRIIPLLKQLDVHKIILFGSLNDKKVHQTSDIDIAIIKKTTKPFLKRLDEIYEKIRPRIAIDFFVYTPEEMKALKKTLLIKKILMTGTTLYES